MREDIKRESRVEVVTPNNVTLVAANVIQLVRNMFLASGRHPMLGDVIDALVVAEELSATTPRAAKNPREYWENILASQLGEGGCLRYLEESDKW